MQSISKSFNRICVQKKFSNNFSQSVCYLILFKAMRPSTQRIQSSSYSAEVTSSKMISHGTSHGFLPDTDKPLEVKITTRKSGSQVEKTTSPFTYISTSGSRNIQVVSSHERQTLYNPRQQFYEPSLGGSQHGSSLMKTHQYQKSFSNSKNSLFNSNTELKDPSEGDLKRMKTIILEKDRCIREMTERLKVIMQQLDRCQIQSKANQCFSRLMTDLSRMFQIPDISIQDVRIQVSSLLQDKKSREHTSRISERKNVEDLQQLIDKLNSQVTSKNMLQIKLVDITNQSTQLKSTIHELNLNIFKLQQNLRESDEQVLVLKRELEQSNMLRRSGNQSMGSQNRMLKLQNDKIMKQRDHLEQQLKDSQKKLLQSHTIIIQFEGKFNSEVRKRDFQQQQLKKQLEFSMTSKENIMREFEEISRHYRQIESFKGELELDNIQLRREIEKLNEDKKTIEQQMMQISRSKEQIKVELIGQQSKIKQEYEHYISIFKQTQNQLHIKLQELIQVEKQKNKEILQYKITIQRLQNQNKNQQEQIQSLKTNKSSIQQLKLDVDGMLHVTMMEMQSLRQQKDVQLDSRVSELKQSLSHGEQLQRQLRIKDEQIEQLKNQYKNQYDNLKNLRQNFQEQYQREHVINTQLQEQLRVTAINVIELQNQVQYLEKQNIILNKQFIQNQSQRQAELQRWTLEMKEKEQRNLETQKNNYQKLVAEEKEKQVVLQQQIEQLRINVHRLQYKLDQNNHTIRFLTQQLDAKDKMNKQLRKSENYNAAQYEKLSLELSTSQKQLFVSKQTQYQKRLDQMNSLMIELQENLRSKETIIQKLNFQLQSINTNPVHQSQHSMNTSNQQITFKQNNLEIEEHNRQLDILRNQNTQLNQKLTLAQQHFQKRQQQYESICAKYQQDVQELKQKILGFQQQKELDNLEASQASVQSSNKQLSVLHSQHSNNELQIERLRSQRYQKLEAENNQQIMQLKRLHAQSIENLQQKYNTSKEQLVKQLKQLVHQMELAEEGFRNQRVQFGDQIKKLTLQLQKKQRQIERYQQDSQKIQPAIPLQQVQELQIKLQMQIGERQNLQLQIKAYQQAIAQLRKQNVEQEKEFDILKQKSMEASSTKVNEIIDVYNRDKQALTISLQNKILQVRTLEDQNSQLKHQILALKQQELTPRPRSIQYTRQLEQKTHSMRELQMQNSSLTITMDDMRKQMAKNNQKIFEITKQYKDQKFMLEKENIELISKVKVLEIKIDQLTFQINSIRQLKSNTLLGGKTFGNLELLENKTSETKNVNTISVNNSIPDKATNLEAFKQKTVKPAFPSTSDNVSSTVISKQIYSHPKQSIVSSVGALKPSIQLGSSSQYNSHNVYSSAYTGHNSINSQFTFNNPNSQSPRNNSPSKFLVNTNFNPISSFNGINSISNQPSLNNFAKSNQKKQTSRESQGRNSPHQQRIHTQISKEQLTRPYFNKSPIRMRSDSSTRNFDYKTNFYSPNPDRNFTSGDFSPRNLIQAAKSVQKQSKVFNYSKVYDQSLKSIKNKQIPPIPQLYDRNKYFSHSDSIGAPDVQTKTLNQQMTGITFNPSSPTFGNPSSSEVSSMKNVTKINLKQFASSYKYPEYFVQNKTQVVKNQEATKANGKQINLNPQGIEKGILVYQKDWVQKTDSCC